jgi:hypothetical protein
MNNSLTHYQTSFRVADTDGEALRSLKKNVYGWVAEKEGDRLVKEKAGDFFYRCEWPNLFRTHSGVVTNTFLSPDGEAWAMHYMEVDSEVGQKRFWYSDIGLKKAGADVIVSVRISYAWNMEDLSGQREEPRTTVPKVVRYLLRGNTVFSGRPEFRLIEEPVRFKVVGMGKVLAEFIKSPDRRYPLIVFNGDGAEQVAEAGRLARELTGKAQVALIGNNAELAEEFQHYMEKDYYVPFGFFRVFFPFNQRRNTPERHRWYDIRRAEYSGQRPGIIHGLLRNHNLVENGAVESTLDIGRLIARENLLKLKAENPAQQKELEEFFKLYADLEKERDQFKNESETYASEVDRLEERVKGLEWRCKDYQSKLDHADVGVPLSIANILPALPTSLIEVAHAAARAFPRLVITEEALKTAEDYGECKCVNEAWQMLVHLSETLHPLKFTGDENDFEGSFKAKTGFDLAMTEGKMTKDDSKLMRLRKLQYGGRDHDISPHVKHGNQEPKLVRIYFAFDQEVRKIVVGHIGRHIPNYTTKKM